MTPHLDRILSWWISVSAGATTVVCIAVLIGTYVEKQWLQSGFEARVTAFEQDVKEDVGKTALLHEELERQRDVSLEREARRDVVTDVLVVAAIVFLASAKWSVRMRGRRLPRIDVIVPAGSSASVENESVRDALSLPVLTADSDPQAKPTDLAVVGEKIERCGRGKESVIPILQAVQSELRYLPDDALQYVCDQTNITPSQIIGVSSFFQQFRRTPIGEHVIKVCHGTACHVAGARSVTDELRRTLGMTGDRDTDSTGQFTIEEVACLGCCTLAPVVQIDDQTYGHLTPYDAGETIEKFRSAQRNGAGRRVKTESAHPLQSCDGVEEIRIGLGSCCVAGGSGQVYEALEDAVAELETPVRIKRVGCVGMCHQTPLIEIARAHRPSALYTGVGPEDAAVIVRRHFRPKRIRKRFSLSVSNLLGKIKGDGRQAVVVGKSAEVRDPPIAAFLGPQKHIATEHFGRLDPTDLDAYLANDGFEALRRSVNGLSPDEIVETVKTSGLRGRGGAGFPSGVKWATVRDAAERRRAVDGATPFVICNGDEGDPGAFMDRMLMESFPYRVIEGMAVAALAIGASEGYFYIRAEYPLAVSRIRDALRVSEERGYLGDDTLGSGRTLRLRIMEGAGAFVCGEETALIASIEGERGSPRLRPPYPAEEGLWGRPTLVNNVETYATIPWILRNGADAFASLGTPTSSGTKVFSLAGKVARGGLIEVPMGTTIRTIVDEIGGGVKCGRGFKAVQIGGPSGGCVPAELADTPIDYETLASVGAIMGSGGLVVLDDTDCMVDLARYFLAFTQAQSCGKCTYCRIGTRRMLDILDRLCCGDGRKGDLDELEQLADATIAGSLCGLGTTAPNPVRSTLRYFREEYEAHLDGQCPAGKCRDLIAYRVTPECVGCTLCAQQCPVKAIEFLPYQMHEIDDAICTRCDICRANCPEEAIEVVSFAHDSSRSKAGTTQVEPV